MSGIMGMLLGAKTAIAAAVDEFFNRVTLLLPGDGTNGAQNNTFLDSSTNNFTITRNGNTTQGTFSPFSQTGWSNFFDGAGDYLTGNGVLVTTTTANTFSCEGWFYPTTFANVIWLVGDMDATGGTNNVAVDISTGGAVELYWWDGAAKRCTSTSVMSLNQWNYFAVVVNSGAISIYVNSTTAGQSGTTTLTNRSAASQNFSVGQYNNSSTPNGYISNLRWSTSARTISSIPTAPYTSDANTRLLICQSNRFVDNSSNGFTLTPSGTPSVQAFSPFAPTAAYSAATVGGSGYFDGTGDYLSNSSDIIIPSTGDFTAQFWVYPTQVTTGQYLIATTNNSGNKFHLYINSSAYVGVQTGSSYRDSSTTKVVANAWNHIACTRTGSTYALFVNGVTQSISGSGTMSSTLDVVPTYIAARDAGTGAISGYLGSSKITTVVETISVPTAPYTSDGNTRLLTNYTNAGITDATAKNDLETVGNAQISTTQSKFGGSSMYFDGTGDYLVSPNIYVGDFLTGDFTIEYWFRCGTQGTSNVTQVGTLDSGSGANSWRFGTHLNTTAGVYFSYHNGSGFVDVTFTTTNYNDNAWHHAALTRSGSTVRAFIDGTQVGSNQTISTSFSARRVVVGAELSTPTYYTGYIDDLRITKGYARYTSNFTAPTSAFSLQ